MKHRKMNGVLLMLAAGLGYFVWIQITGLGIPCIFRTVTGWLCPGCGITTLILKLARLDMKGAFMANPFLMITSPLLIAEGIYAWYCGRKQRQLPKWNQYCLGLYIIALMLFGIIRNF